MRKYFNYELKKNIFIIGVLTLISTLIYVISLLTNSDYIRWSTYDSCLWLISVIGGLLAACVPVFMFNYKMHRRSVDLYYALPISRFKILFVRFCIGLLAVFIPYTVAYWLGAFVVMGIHPENLAAIWYLPQFFASLIPVYFIYAMSSFAFTRANSILDGILFIVFWAFAISLVMFTLESLTTFLTDFRYDEGYGLIYATRVFYIKAEYYLPFKPLDFVTCEFANRLVSYYGVHEQTSNTVEIVHTVIGFTLTGLLAAGATAGLFVSEKYAKSENAGQISDSWFGYRVMIPLFTVCLMAICSEIILLVLVAVAAFVLCVAYKRSLKIGIKQTIILASAIIAGAILAAIIHYVIDVPSW